MTWQDVADEAWVQWDWHEERCLYMDHPVVLDVSRYGRRWALGAYVRWARSSKNFSSWNGPPIIALESCVSRSRYSTVGGHLP